MSDRKAKRPKQKAKRAPEATSRRRRKGAKTPNPRIAKADGDAPVRAYIDAMPGWTRDAGRRLDALIVKTVPGVKKAVKWNTPLYGMDGMGWFLGFHCFTRYVKVTFFRGASLKPPPPVPSNSAQTRYLHIHEGETPDAAQLTQWIKQACRLPGFLAP